MIVGLPSSRSSTRWNRYIIAGVRTAGSSRICVMSNPTERAERSVASASLSKSQARSPSPHQGRRRDHRSSACGRCPPRSSSTIWRRRRWCNGRSEEHTSELQSLMRISYAVFFLKKKTKTTITHDTKRKKYKYKRIRVVTLSIENNQLINYSDLSHHYKEIET